MNDPWKIEAGIGIGPFKLGMAEADVIELSDRWTEESMGEYHVCKTNNFSAWIKDGKLSQIGTHGDARVVGPFGLTLGMALADFDATIWVDTHNGVLRFKDHPGLTFDVGGDFDLIEILDDVQLEGAILRLDKTLTVDWIGVDDCFDEFELLCVDPA